MIARRRLLATTLLAAAAAGVPVRAAAQPGLPADPDGTIPAPLTARGGAGLLEPGFPIGHVAVRGGDSVRFRTAAGWGPWQPVGAGCAAGSDRTDGRGGRLLAAGGAIGVELDPGPGADAEVLAINTTDGPRRTAARRAVPTDPPPGVHDRVRYRNRAGWEADESLRFGPTARSCSRPRSSRCRPSPCTTRSPPTPTRHRPRPSARSTSRTPSPRASATSATTCSSTSRAACTRAAGREPTRSRCSGRAAAAR